MSVSAEMLSLMAGALVGWVLARAFSRASGWGHKAVLVAAVLMIGSYISQGGISELESVLSQHLQEFFNSSRFALGALIGAVLGGGSSTGNQQTYSG